MEEAAREWLAKLHNSHGTLPKAQESVPTISEERLENLEAVQKWACYSVDTDTEREGLLLLVEHMVVFWDGNRCEYLEHIDDDRSSIMEGTLLCGYYAQGEELFKVKDAICVEGFHVGGESVSVRRKMYHSALRKLNGLLARSESQLQVRDVVYSTNLNSLAEYSSEDTTIRTVFQSLTDSDVRFQHILESHVPLHIDAETEEACAAAPELTALDVDLNLPRAVTTGTYMCKITINAQRVTVTPNGLTSEQVATLNDVQQKLDTVSAISLYDVIQLLVL